MVDIPKNKKVILFDGVCNLCNHSVLKVIKYDKKNIFLFNQALLNFEEKKYEKITTTNYSVIKNKISNYIDKIK